MAFLISATHILRLLEEQKRINLKSDNDNKKQQPVTYGISFLFSTSLMWLVPHSPNLLSFIFKKMKVNRMLFSKTIFPFHSTVKLSFPTKVTGKKCQKNKKESKKRHGEFSSLLKELKGFHHWSI